MCTAHLVGIVSDLRLVALDLDGQRSRVHAGRALGGECALEIVDALHELTANALHLYETKRKDTIRYDMIYDMI